ncbi:MAG: hypothetical protein ACOYOE_12025 [Chlorobium sp.]
MVHAFAKFMIIVLSFITKQGLLMQTAIDLPNDFVAFQAVSDIRQEIRILCFLALSAKEGHAG